MCTIRVVREEILGAGGSSRLHDADADFSSTPNRRILPYARILAIQTFDAVHLLTAAETPPNRRLASPLTTCLLLELQAVILRFPYNLQIVVMTLFQIRSDPIGCVTTVVAGWGFHDEAGYLAAL